MKQIFENYNNFLNEDVHSSQMRDFIRFSKKTEKFDVPKRVQLLYAYLRANLKFMGGGANRQVWQSDSGEIVKIVMLLDDPQYYPDFIMQNEAEIEKFNRPDIEVFPRIENTDPESLWFIVERVNVLSGKQEEYEHLFPKLTRLLGTQFGMNVAGKDLDRFLVKILIFEAEKINLLPPRPAKKDLGISTESFYAFLRGIRSEIDFYSRNPSVMQDKEFIEAFFNYLKRPDLNVRRILRAVKEANVSPHDLRAGNLGYDGDIVKIIDAGF